jgi:hypothetical protein
MVRHAGYNRLIGKNPPSENILTTEGHGSSLRSAGPVGCIGRA